MRILTETAIAHIMFDLSWKCDAVHHRASRHAEKASLWRDVFPDGLNSALLGCSAGDVRSLHYEPGRLVPSVEASGIRTVPRRNWDSDLVPGVAIQPIEGRYFPQGVLWKAGIAGIYRPSTVPLRVVACDADNVIVDLNHPLAPFALDVRAEVVSVIEDRGGESGGRSADVTRLLTTGPGIEARRDGKRPDFFSGDALRPLDPSDDALFYANERMVAHIDAVAERELCRYHAEHLNDGMVILDLMSSVQSHLPDGLRPASVTGLGMNARELAANRRLAEWVVHDLNRDPRLPFDDARFDAALCALSIEYLHNPLAVVAEVARVLKPGAPFVISWSQRWFPTKAVRLWVDLHPFERVGYVLSVLERSDRFEALASYSMHGLSRPWDDPHAAEDNTSDPLFAVSARRR